MVKISWVATQRRRTAAARSPLMVTKGMATKGMVTKGMVTKGMVTKGMVTKAPYSRSPQPVDLCLLPIISHNFINLGNMSNILEYLYGRKHT